MQCNGNWPWLNTPCTSSFARTPNVPSARPPWGEPTIERYVERIRENLATLRQYPQLKIGFEWSGLELELLADDAPDVFQEMCDLAKAGQTTFYNGTYAQPHLQMLSSEANYRQFEYGMKVYRERCDWQIRTYLHQEASVHDQVPQLLKAFGIDYAVTPQFSSTLAWQEESEITMLSRQGPRFVQGNEFAAWTGLDGSQIYLYLRVPLDKSLDDLLANEAIAGRQRVPSIIVDVARSG